MKDLLKNNILNLYKNEEKFLINSNHQINNIITNFTINNYFKNLEETRNIELSILHSKISYKEKINYSSFEKSELFLKIKDIIKKYKNFPLININHLQNISLKPKPLNDTINLKIIPNFDYKLFPDFAQNELIKKKPMFLNKKRKAPSLKTRKIKVKNKSFITLNEKKDEEN